LTAEVDSDGASASFKIPQLTSILSNQIPRKVTIAILELEADIIHYIAPDVATWAFMHARAVNNSSYPLLESFNVCVYVDDSLVAKTRLKPVSVGESFSLFLGADASVQVETRPLKTYDRQHGFITKSNQTAYEYITNVSNTRATTVKFALVQQVPISTDEAIKVKIVSPRQEEVREVDSRRALGDLEVARLPISEDFPEVEFQEDDSIVWLNLATNNVVWVEQLGPSQKTELTYSYSIDWPLSKEIVVL